MTPLPLPLSLMRAVLILVVVLLGTTPRQMLYAAASPFYDVANLPAEATADNAKNARDQALATAQRLGLREVLSRLGVDPALAEKASPDVLAAMVRSFGVEDERASAIRYQARYNIRFRPQTVNTFLARHNVVAAPPEVLPSVLVLPITVRGTRRVLWEETTPWRAAWDNEPATNGRVPIVMAEGDLEDIKRLGTLSDGVVQPQRLAAVMQRYNTNRVSIVSVTLDVGDPARVQVLLQSFAELHPLAPVTFTASLPWRDVVRQVRGRLDEVWRNAAPPTNAPAADSPATTPEPASEAPQEESPAFSTPDATAASAPVFEAQSSTAGGQGSFRFHAHVRDLAAWTKTYQRLVQLRDVKINLATLSKTWVTFDIITSLPFPVVRDRLRASGLDVYQDAHGWAVEIL